MRQKQELHDYHMNQSTEAEEGDLENPSEDLLVQQKRHLGGAIAKGYEMEALAIGAKVNLEGQGHQLERSYKQLDGVQSDIGLSSRLLNAIEAQRRRNKYVLWAIYALLFICFIYIMSWFFSWTAPLDSAHLQPLGRAAPRSSTDPDSKLN